MTMRKLLFGSLLAFALTGATVLAAEERPPVPVRGTEGPDVRVTQNTAPAQPVKGVEGPGVR